jgi:hypothetical protein
MKTNHQRNFVQKPVPPRRRVWHISRRDRQTDSAAGACIGNDFTDGHRGEARAKRGAKHYVHSRLRARQKDFLIKIYREI